MILITGVSDNMVNLVKSVVHHGSNHVFTSHNNYIVELFGQAFYRSFLLL